jgi:hypothetical protein
MLAQYWANKVGLAGVLVAYGCSVVLLDLIGTHEFAALTAPLILIPLASIIARPCRWFSGMLIPGILICATGVLAYGSLNWTDAPSASLAYAAFLLLAAAWGFAIYRVFSMRT